MADEILVSVADGIATVTMNRPAQRNAMRCGPAAMLRARTGGTLTSFPSMTTMHVSTPEKTSSLPSGGA